MSDWGFAAIWESAARTFPERPALIHGGDRRSWGEFDRRAGALGATLEASGLQPGDVVAQYMRNRPEYLETFFAALKIGLRPMNTNYRYVDEELLEVWNDAGVKAVVFDAEFRPQVDRARSRMPRVLAWIEVGGESADSVTPYADAIAAAPVAHGRADENSIILIYTGGTTGHPKGVMWRQGDLCSLLNSQNGKPIADSVAADGIDRHLRESSVKEIPSLVASPLMHGAGLFYASAALASGGTVVTLPGRSFSPHDLLGTIERERVKSLAIVGDAFARPVLAVLDAQPGRWDTSSLRFVFSSGVMWSSEVKLGWLRHMPQAVLNDGLGSSEASAVGSTVSRLGDVADTATFKPSDRAAVILDDGTFAQPGDGKVGRIAVTGWIPVGYLNDPEKSAATFVEVDGKRWSLPGDLAQLDADGRIRLLGRGSSVINTGGEKVFAEEVEEVLKRHPAVADAAVLGIPDERLGRRVVALVEPVGAAPPEQALIDFVKARLASYKAPWHVALVPSVERGVNGKLDHRRLSEIAEKKWGQGISDFAGLPARAGVVETEEVRPGVLLVRLNRPDNLNSMNAALIQALREVFYEIRDDARVRAIIVTGAGRAFCAGLDLRGYGAIAAAHDAVEGRPQAGMRLQKHIADLVDSFRSCRAPVIAAVNGPAVGGGFSMALWCDIRMMATSAAMHAAFIKRGLGGTDMGSSWLLPRLIGFSRAAEVLLTGRDIDAAEALEIGLASSVHEPGELLGAAIAKAEQIASNSPMGVWMTKEVLWSNLEVPSLRAGVDLENRSQILTALTKDHREAVAAFLEKRPPEFRNQ